MAENKFVFEGLDNIYRPIVRMVEAVIPVRPEAEVKPTKPITRIRKKGSESDKEGQ